MRYFLLVIVTLLMVFDGWAQEKLVPLKENKVLQLDERPEYFQRLVPLELPFFDDFYPLDIYPDVNFWEDKLVYVNATYPIEPPTIGVATFDGLNAEGNAYSILEDAHGVADMLTSLEINLDGLTNNDDVYLSFFYQPQGLGETPDYEEGDITNRDSFIVEFKDTSDTWIAAWSVHEDSIQDFEQVFVKVEEAFLHGNFQFRFKAVGRLTGAFDHWHLDYVRLDKNRDLIVEATIPEMAYQYWPSSLLDPYFAMPYVQFDSTYLADSHRVFIRNNFIQLTTDIIDFYEAELVNTGQILDVYSGPSRDVGPTFSFIEEYDNFNIPTDVSDDTVIVSVTYNFLVSAEDTSNVISDRNNTIVKDQVFNNFYSYDDGTAEAAYVLEPRRNDALFGRSALKFETAKADTLQAVKAHFVSFNEELDNLFFSLLVWKSLESDSTEDVLLYEENFIRLGDLPTGDSVDMLNGFSYIPLNPEFIVDGSEALIVEGDFYVGLGTEVEVFLPIGWDKNTDGSDFHFFNLGLEWVPTQFDGSLMLNPVLGDPLPEQYVVSVEDDFLNLINFDFYPNPVRGKLIIESSLSNAIIEILDVSGRKVMEQNWTSGRYLDVSTLHPGWYVLKVKDTATGEMGSAEFIKQ